jgi:hypothetical protein
LAEPFVLAPDLVIDLDDLLDFDDFGFEVAWRCLPLLLGNGGGFSAIGGEPDGDERFDIEFFRRSLEVGRAVVEWFALSAVLP